MTNKELRDILAKLPDDANVYVKDDGIFYLVATIEAGHEYQAEFDTQSWWYRSGMPDDGRETRAAIGLSAF